jgi:transmembrane sensor
LALYPAELDPQLTHLLEPEVSESHWFWRRTLLATAATLILALGAWFLVPPGMHEGTLYRTARGERIEVHLADGSLMQINSGSELRVTMEKDRRAVSVVRGEALFDVAHDPNRRFVVNTPRGKVEAIGTQFNVNVYQDDLIVTVTEGKILISNSFSSPNNQAAEIAVPGQQVAVAADGRIVSKTLEDMSQTLAWTQGKIIFRGETLEQAVAQANRHNLPQIDILDARLRHLPVYGVFKTGDSTGFLSALERSYSLAAVTDSEQFTYLVYRNSDH